MSHPTDAELSALVEGRLSATQAIALRDHSLECDQCLARLDALESGEVPTSARLGRYVLLDLIGEGGMGRVVRAYDPQLDRRCALKLVRPDLATTDAAARLVREAQAMARVQHPNIVAVFDAGEVDGKVFVAMELVEGPTLADWLAEPRPWREVVQHFIEAGRGLQAAHQAGLVHRDFKPANVLLKDGTAKVTDFGLARPAEAPQSGTAIVITDLRTTVTQPGLVMGTPAYMAPEQREGVTDARSDQYAFGVSLFEALHGHRPQDATPQRPVPRWLDVVNRRLLEKDPARRFASMAEVVAALERGVAVRQTRLVLAIAGVLLVTTFGGVAMARAQRHAQCDGVTAELEQSWSATTQKALEERFSKAPWALAIYRRANEPLGAWAARWSGARRASCEASRISGRTSDQIYTLESLCLDRRLNQFAAVVEALQRLPVEDAAQTERVVPALVDELPGLEACADQEALLRKTGAESEAQQREALPWRKRMAEAVTTSAAGKDARALELSRQVSQQVEALKNPVLRAEALSVEGQLEIRAGTASAAREKLLEAWTLATAAGEDEIALRAWLDAMPLVIIDDDTLELARRVAVAQMQRVGPTPLHEAGIAYRVGRVYFLRGDYRHAVDEFRKAWQLRLEELGPDHQDTLRALGNVSASLTRVGKVDEALEMQRQIYETVARTSGPDSVLAMEARSDYGAQLSAAHHDAEARPVLEQVLERIDREQSSNTTTLYSTIDNLAFATMRLGDLKRARALRDRQVAFAQQVFGPSTNLYDAYTWRAELGLREGNMRAALEDAKEGARGLREIAKDHAELPWALFYLAESATAAGDAEMAKAALTEARALVTSTDDELAAQLWLTEACALRPSGDAEAAGKKALTWFAAQPRLDYEVALARKRIAAARLPWADGEVRCAW